MTAGVSVLFNEPKLLKCKPIRVVLRSRVVGFSALQRAEIAEIRHCSANSSIVIGSFSALQRAEIAEIVGNGGVPVVPVQSFSALQRAEIAEM